LAYFLSKFGCHGNSFGFLEILDSIFEVSATDNLTIHAKSIDFLHRTEISEILAKCRLIDLPVVINVQNIPLHERYQNNMYLKEKSQLLVTPTSFDSQFNKMVYDNFK